MDMSVYKKTRYQNIYKHKNGNYVVMINKPVKSSISRIDGEKIWKIEEALKIRDNPKTGYQKRTEILYKDNFDSLWDKYINNCIYVKKLSFSTLKKKKNIYKKYFENKINKPISKLDKEFFSKYVDELDTTLKEKNEILRQLKSFFNWCIEEEFLLYSPIKNIKPYKTTKNEMKYWTIEDTKKFFEYMNSLEDTEVNLRIKTFVLLGFSLGDRVGETRALTFECVKPDKVIIKHSINYDRKSSDFLASTKTYQSQRIVDISENLYNAVIYFKEYLMKIGYNITDNTLIFLNHNTGKPIDDVSLRKEFYSFCDKAEVPRIRLYDLRHTFATTMMTEGYEVYAFSKIMGHKSIKTTIDQYGHISEKLRKEINNTTDKIVF